MGKLNRKVEFDAGFDCIRFECKHGSKSCRPGAGGSHGKHGLNIRWIVSGKEGAIQFLLYAGWLPETKERNQSHPPMAADLGYHAKKPQFKGQEKRPDCPYIKGPCYYDGSGLQAEEPFRVLCNEGGEALWAYLEKVYQSRFHNKKWPGIKPYKWKARGSND